ncbi:MAG: type II toxin-antitoxin system RelE/ParE family toxin [Nitrospirae bacterium]|nr:type II toxin-antitoxin system RelE/ParE family toxin [Nitrospirota bacterium]
MIKSFRIKGTEDIFDRKNTSNARHACPQQIWRVAQRKLDQLNGVVSLESLKIPPGNLLESLRDNRKGQHSIRINDQFRVCFVWTDDGAENVEITDYH